MRLTTSRLLLALSSFTLAACADDATTSSSSASSSGQGGASSTTAQTATVSSSAAFMTGSTGSGTCTLQCSDDLHSVVDCHGAVVTTCPDDQGCGPELTCIPACDAADAAKSTTGCEYYASTNLGFGCYAVFALNSWSVPVSVQIDDGATSIDPAAVARIPTGNGQAITYAPLPNGQIPPNEVAIFFLGGTGCPAGITPPASGSGKQFHVTASAPIVAYDIDPYGGGASAVTSASLLIPTSAWDLNYIAVAPWPFGSNSLPPRLRVTASENATSVTINPTVAITGGKINNTAVPGTPANTPATYVLQKGDSLVFEQQEELTGSPILADKPVGVTGSSGCINIDACCCDGAHQQIPPVRALGSEYVAVRYRNRVATIEESPPWRIVGAVDGTVLTYDPAPPSPDAPTSLSLGQIATFRAAGPFVVKSQDADHPFYLAGYMTGAGDFDDAGDPEFVNVIPAQQYRSEYVFFADPTYPETNLVLVRSRAQDGTFKDVVLDCAGVVTGFTPIDADHEYARFDLVRGNFEKQGNCDNGRREIHSDAPFGLTVWGWGTHATDPTFNSTYVSYAYPAGAKVEQINDIVVVPVPQ